MATPAAAPARTTVNASMYESGKYSNMTIVCKEKTCRVHRCIVCLQSKPLAAAVDGGFKEGINKEVNLDDNEPEIVGKMLEYLYNADYSDGRVVGTSATASNTPSKPASIRFKRSKLSRPSIQTQIASEASTPQSAAALFTNAQVFVIADKYDIQGLKELATKKYTELVSNNWNSEYFVNSLKLLYEETPESDRLLKNVAITTAGKQTKELVDRGEFAALCKENGEIAFDVMKASFLSSQMHTCGDCGRTDAETSFYCSDNDGRWYCNNCTDFRWRTA
ncbi:hypothetical protein LSUE1_G003669 [Lachnellula suecica]|uniref:BTB domain-containing protein n=1 Tax=Lachnellula suecica TaxID=602035 RepID=A0A8T9CDB8_9HELO|nr:hypothetical protein LSUE1_G003669 [Lachnellula suecica]